jgi:hypothetical protein
MLFCAKSARAQVTLEGDSVKIETPIFSTSIDHSIQIQNLDNLSQSVSYWSNTGKGTFFVPWCNFRVSRTAFAADLVAFSEWSVDLRKADVSVKVSSMPNKQVQVDVSGGNFTLQMRHIAYGGWYPFQNGGVQYYPQAANLAQGKYTFFIPYKIPGAQVAMVTVHAGGCSQKIAKIFY